GLDIANKAIHYAKSELTLNVYKEDFLNFKVNEKYTDIFLWDVIEHLPRPDQVLEKAHSCLTDSGRIFLTTGDIGSLLPRWQKEKWRMIHPPSHLHYFSASTIRKLLESKGFRIIDIRYPAIHRSVRQIFYSLFMLEKKPNGWKERILQSIPEHWSIPINTFDIMFVIAERS
ncbi:MAG: class I SAM-dependent methyltransferase, partial [Saprospiraceae bacterium]|nr:class I SAM-dependent methyltransferase [Saprospiraceae bacterium]